MLKRIVLYLILIEIVLIGFVGLNIAKRLSKVSVNPIDARPILTRSVDGLQYYYEPKPNFTWEVDAYLLDRLGYPPEAKVSFATNDDGLNHGVDYPLKKDPNVTRIITLGASFTFGHNVNPEDNYPSRLEKLLKDKCEEKFEVINLGVIGYDIQYSVERFKLKGQKYNPDLVLWLISEGDVKIINEEFRPRLEAIHDNIRREEGLKTLANKMIDHSIWNSAFDEMSNKLGGEDKVLKFQEQYIQKINSYYQKDLVLLTFASTSKKYKDFLRDFAVKRPNTFYHDHVVDIFQNRKYYLADDHPSPAGYKVISENIFNYLLNNKIIKCSG